MNMVQLEEHCDGIIRNRSIMRSKGTVMKRMKNTEGEVCGGK
jgi:hypothetical protein